MKNLLVSVPLSLSLLVGSLSASATGVYPETLVIDHHALGLDQGMLTAEEQELASTLLEGVKSEQEKKSILKKIKEARSDFKAVMANSEHRAQVKAFMKKIKAFRKGEMSQDAKEQLVAANKACELDKASCQRQIPRLKQVLAHELLPKGDHFDLSGMAIGCAQDGFTYADEELNSFHVLLLGKTNLDCGYDIETLHIGPGLFVSAAGARLTFCLPGMREGTHIGFSAQAGALIAPETGIMMGASGLCLNIGIGGISVGARASFDITQIDK